MLHTAAPFPYAGSPAFVLPDSPGEEPVPVRIIRRHPDGTALVGKSDVKYPHESASANFTIALERLVATREEAFLPGVRSSRAKSRGRKEALQPAAKPKRQRAEPARPSRRRRTART